MVTAILIVFIIAQVLKVEHYKLIFFNIMKIKLLLLLCCGLWSDCNSYDDYCPVTLQRE